MTSDSRQNVWHSDVGHINVWHIWHAWHVWKVREVDPASPGGEEVARVACHGVRQIARLNARDVRTKVLHIICEHTCQGI